MNFCLKNKALKCLLFLLAGACIGVLPLQAKPFGRGVDFGGGESLGLPDIRSLSQEDLDMSADSYEYVGSNLIARGHAVIKLNRLQITADAITVNLLTKDLEAAGNVVFSVQTTSRKKVTPEEYEKLMENPAIKVFAQGIATKPDGNQSIQVVQVQNSSKQWTKSSTQSKAALCQLSIQESATVIHVPM